MQRSICNVVSPIEKSGSDLSKFTECKQAIEEEEKSLLKVLLIREVPPCEDYIDYENCKADADSSSNDRINDAFRCKLCEWCYDVIDHLCYDREIVAIAINFLDRTVALKMLASGDQPSKNEFQLIAVTSLYIATKLHGATANNEGPTYKLRIKDLVKLSRGVFTAEVIEAMELEILQTLEWRVNPPTRLLFVGSFLRLCPGWISAAGSQSTSRLVKYTMSGIYDVARYLSELSVCVSSFSFTCKDSVIAYASIYCAMDALQKTHPIPYQVRVTFLNNVVESTGLRPEMEEVRRVREMIKNLCPAIFEEDGVPAEFLWDRASTFANTDQQCEEEANGKVSPVCIIDTDEVGENTSRYSGCKRSRP